MWQIAGQDRILALLDYSLKNNSVAHAYLLVGPRHVGKGTLALNLAQALNCDGINPPCGQCRSCRRILENKHADVISIGLNSRTEIGIDDIRELQHLATLPPYEGKYKVFIIEDAEYFSTEAANSLLKVLEEPPPKVIWLLLTAEEQRLLPTVASRCQRLKLKPMSLDQTQRILVNSYKVEPSKAKLLARLCHGCLGWALSVIANDNLFQQRRQTIDKLSSLLTANLEERFAYAQVLAAQLSQHQRIAAEVARIWLSWWRDLMLIESNCKEAITNIDYEEVLEKQAEVLSLSEIECFISKLNSVQEGISRNVSPRLALESLMLSLPRKGGVLSGD